MLNNGLKLTSKRLQKENELAKCNCIPCNRQTALSAQSGDHARLFILQLTNSIHYRPTTVVMFFCFFYYNFLACWCIYANNTLLVIQFSLWYSYTGRCCFICCKIIDKQHQAHRKVSRTLVGSPGRLRCFLMNRLCAAS